RRMLLRSVERPVTLFEREQEKIHFRFHLACDSGSNGSWTYIRPVEQGRTSPSGVLDQTQDWLQVSLVQCARSTPKRCCDLQLVQTLSHVRHEVTRSPRHQP